MNHPHVFGALSRRQSPLRARSRRPSATHRRSRMPLALALVALLLAPSTAFAGGRLEPAVAASPISNMLACTRTVSGFTAAAVAQARDQAGVGAIVCFPAGLYTGTFRATVAGQTWRLAPGARLWGPVLISGAGVTVTGGMISRPLGDRWIASVEIRADNVTVTQVVFWGGGTGVGVYGKDRARIISNSFRNLSGSAVSVWSEGVGADRTMIYGNIMIQSVTHEVSPITSRGNEGGSHGGVQNFGTVIRRNSIDQGAGDIGWFGIELKQSRSAVIESNSIKGGTVLTSLPETDNALIRWNTFDLRGTAHWGIEVANAYDATVTENTFVGDGPTGVDYALSMNTNPLRTIVTNNTASNLRTLVGIAGDGHQILNNCLTSVANVTEFMLNGGPHIVISGNGAC